jgi:hypothetical protein
VDDELLTAIVRMILAHPQGATIVVYLGVVGLVANVANGLLPAKWREHRVWGIALRLLDRLCVLTNRDASGTLKPPGAASHDPDDHDDPPPPPQATPPRSNGTTGIMTAWVCMSLVVGAVSIAPLACSDPARQAAHLTIVGAGSVTASLHQEHQATYVRATDALRRRLRDSGTIADYEREVEPIDREFADRSEALQALSASLYGAAAIVDATRSGAGVAEYALAARTVAIAIDRALMVLERGGVLDPVPIPPEITAITATLRAIAEGHPR